MVDEGDHCEADGSHFCKVDDSSLKLATAHSSMQKLPPCDSKASNAAKTLVFLTASLLKVKKFEPFLGKFVARPEADGIDLRQADGG